MRRVLASGLSTEDQKDPEKIWDLLESQVDATVKINFRVHRLEFFNMRQKPDEDITTYMSRLREKATKCEFVAEELHERLIEMIILSTPFDDFRKELLTKVKGHEIRQVLERGRDYEAIQASQASLSAMKGNGPRVDEVSVQKQKCHNCWLNHAPRSCPAYRDKCHTCGRLGHWKKLCRSGGSGPKKFQRSHKYERNNTSGHARDTKTRHRFDRRGQHELCVSDNESTSDSDTQAKSFYSLQVSDIALHNIDRSEAYASLIVHPTHPRVEGPIRLKVDTGAAGNTLPLRTYKQMFGDTPHMDILERERVRLTSYSGHSIKCIGSLKLGLQRRHNNEIQQHKFYVVDVPGPAIMAYKQVKT
ncbi:PREDICTED: uncharacterized protein LOC106808892 [Priapulus caudatus]|uniref:Uncharacterized protein LOC106808892 n=1 Tax=Priapulus caudatus TaxID=37621 RepID=A0ABM1E514_PRICU|nr:PREDICTED: uncharacterized protein LOC106808892 [Priapulus caudatus]